MKTAVEALLKKMNEDKVFAESILVQTDKDNVIELANNQGIKLTLDDIDEANTIIKMALETNETEGELSEAELETVAGGTLHIATIVVFLTALGFSATISTVAMTSAGAVTASIITTVANNK